MSLFGQSSQGNSSQFASNPGQQSTISFGTSRPASASLFGTGNSQNQTGAAAPFGQPNTQTQTGAGLFGISNNATQNQSSTGAMFGSSQGSAGPGLLFGANTSQAASVQQKSSGIFGTPLNQTSTSSGAFMGSNANQQSSGSNLFSASTTSQIGGGLFGNSTQQGIGGMFGSSASGQQTGLRTGGLSGQPTNNNPFRLNTQPLGASYNLLSATQQPQQQASLFGASQNQQPQQTALSGSSIYALNEPRPQQASMSGSLIQGSFSSTRPLPALTMGSANTANKPPVNSVPGVKIDVSNLRGTTRFGDLHEELQKQIEQIDNFIQTQISFKEQCDAVMPGHAANLTSVPSDVELVRARYENAELALDNDSEAIKGLKDLVIRDAADARRSFRATETLKLPHQFHYSSSLRNTSSAAVDANSAEDDPSDLVSYFNRMTDEMSKTLEVYRQNLAEIETHLQTVESTTVSQNQKLLSMRGPRSGNSRNGEDQIRELGAVLRQFEGGILGVAERVGNARETLSELISKDQ